MSFASRMTFRIWSSPRSPTASHLTCAMTPLSWKSPRWRATHASRSRMAFSSASPSGTPPRLAMGASLRNCSFPFSFPAFDQSSGKFSFKSSASPTGKSAHCELRSVTFLSSPSAGKSVTGSARPSVSSASSSSSSSSASSSSTSSTSSSSSISGVGAPSAGVSLSVAGGWSRMVEGSMTATAAGIRSRPATFRMLSVGSGSGESLSAVRLSSHVRSPSAYSARIRVEVSVSFSTRSRSLSWS